MVNDSYIIRQLTTSSTDMINFVYIIFDKGSRQAAVIDPAWDLDKVDGILKELGATLTHIFLTHSHNDHVNLVNPLLELYNPMVCMSVQEADYYGFHCNNLHKVSDYEKFLIGNTEITCILTPGHTAGGMCYLLPGTMFSGDTVFMEGCGKCDDDGGSAGEMFESIQKIKTVVPLDTEVYSGHSFGKDQGIQLSRLLKENIYFQFQGKESFINFRMRKNQNNLFSFK